MIVRLNTKEETYLLIIWTQALVATLGSLFFSEIRGYIPCELCWTQRIFMYPLVIIYGVALFKKNKQIAFPGIILSGIGMCVSIYHYSLQKIQGLQAVGGICGDVPCTLQYVNYFGFITIPLLAGIAFMIIFILHLLLIRKGTHHEK
jgi:disulfide bond formation protein DsbB